MNSITENNRAYLEDLLRMNQDSLFQHVLTSFLELKSKKNFSMVLDKEFIYIKGTVPVMIVTHLDTFHERGYGLYDIDPHKAPAYDEDKIICFDLKHRLMWSPEGLGADDRAGVFMAMMLLKKEEEEIPSFLFTRDEEIGGLGAKAFVERYKIGDIPIDDLKYIMQLDRMGHRDCVFYSCDNFKFKKYVESFGYVTTKGSFSDISVICPSIGIAGVNLSVGYYDEHTFAEHLGFNDLDDNYLRVESMIEDAKNIKNVYKYIPKKTKVKYLEDYDKNYTRTIDHKNSNYDWYDYDNYESYKDDIELPTPCDLCGELMFEEDIAEIDPSWGVVCCHPCKRDFEI